MKKVEVEVMVKDSKKVERQAKLKEKSQKRVHEMCYGRRGSEFLYENGDNRRISKDRLFQFLLVFIKDTVLYMANLDKDKRGGYFEYYLVHSDEYQSKDIIDYVKCYDTIKKIFNLMNMPELKDKKFLKVSTILRYSQACFIFEYKYNGKYFQKWQDDLFRILTLQDIPKKK